MASPLLPVPKIRFGHLNIRDASEHCRSVGGYWVARCKKEPVLLPRMKISKVFPWHAKIFPLLLFALGSKERIVFGSFLSA